MNKKLAFTLIEVLIVIVVIGIISSFIIVSVSSITNNARIAKGQAFSSSTKNALLMNLVSEWRLDGDATDFWGGKNGTLVGPPASVSSCPQNTCYSFDGDDYIWIADNPVFNFGTKMSAFVWLKGGAQSGYKAFFANFDSLNKRSWWMGNSGSPYNKIQIIFSDDGTDTSGHYKTYVSNNVFFDNNWHLVGFTWSAGTFLMYIDGQSVSYATSGSLTTNSLYNSDANITLGCYMNNGSPWQYFVGQLDEARLYNEPIPASQIEQNYYSGLNKLLTNNSITNNEYSERLSELGESLTEN